MKEIICWDRSGLELRKAVVALCGWVTGAGKVTKTGKRIAETAWNSLTPAAQNVLISHGITK